MQIVARPSLDLVKVSLVRVDRIVVDATRPATLNDGVGSQTDFATLEAAVVAWHALPADVKIRATVKVIGGPVYRAYQIDRLYYGPKPDTAE
jgi:hypothetical protein